MPKGFEKFAPKKDMGSKVGTGAKPSSNGTGGTRAETSKPTEGGNSNGGSGGSPPGGNKNPFGGKGSGGGGRKKPPQNEVTVVGMSALGAVGATAILYFLSKNTGFEKKISWQEFENVILPSGTVEKIEVINRSVARIIRKPNTSGDLNRPPGWNAPEFDPPQEQQVFTPSDGTAAPSESKSSEEIVLDNKFIKITRHEPPEIITIGSVESFERKLDEAQKNLRFTSKERIPVFYLDETNWGSVFMDLAPTLLILGLLVAAMRQGGPQSGIFGMQKSRAVRAVKGDMKVTFKDVAGCDEAKREIMEFVEFLKNHKKFTDLGAKIPRGALLCGPPGTGKTMLAKATAGEADVPFFSISGSDFTEMFVGVGAARVRDMFKEARENAPCIIFIDEIDAVGGKRGRNVGGIGGNSERENTLNQLLVEMDGFAASDNIVVLAGTNRADVLDPALLRPGRFDRQINVDKPDIKGRKEIFEVYLKNIKLNGPPSEFSSRLAALTPGFTGADISNICNEAAIVAARNNKTAVDMIDFESATDRVIGGLESSKIISPEERRVVAYHEAGHAVAGWFLEFADPLLKVTIVPRGSGTLGFAQYLPKELMLRTKDQILDIVCMALAGRAAEQVNFGRVTSGAADDLRRVTNIVYQMVQVYGMNSKVGQVSFPQDQSSGYPQERVYSESTAEMIDGEVRQMVEEAYQRTIALMEEKKEQVKLVAELLLKKETISHTDVADLIGERPYSAGKEYDSYVAHTRSKPPASDPVAEPVVSAATSVEQQKIGGGDTPSDEGPGDIAGDRLVAQPGGVSEAEKKPESSSDQTMKTLSSWLLGRNANPSRC